MVITERSSKEDIIGSALELTDDQAAEIARLRDQQRVLMLAVVILSAWIILF